MSNDDLIYRPHQFTSSTTELRVHAWKGPDGIVWDVSMESEGGGHIEYRSGSRADAIRKAAELAITWECPLTVSARAYVKLPEDDNRDSNGNVISLRDRGRPPTGRGFDEF